MLKFKLYYDKDKETRWLNEMAAEGWAMTGFFMGVYRFDPCEKGKYTYQIDIQDSFFGLPQSYRELMKELNIEIVQRWGAWVILRKETSEDRFELYTDAESRIEHYGKILKTFKIASVVEMIALFMELFAAIETGEMLYWLFTILLAVLCGGFACMAMQTKERIQRLKAEVEGTDPARSRTMSPYLMLGLLINSIGLLARNSFPVWLSYVLLITAIVLMLLGSAETAKNNRK